MFTMSLDMCGVRQCGCPSPTSECSTQLAAFIWHELLDMTFVLQPTSMSMSRKAHRVQRHSPRHSTGGVGGGHTEPAPKKKMCRDDDKRHRRLREEAGDGALLGEVNGQQGLVCPRLWIPRTVASRPSVPMICPPFGTSDGLPGVSVQGTYGTPVGLVLILCACKLGTHGQPLFCVCRLGGNEVMECAHVMPCFGELLHAQRRRP